MGTLRNLKSVVFAGAVIAYMTFGANLAHGDAAIRWEFTDAGYGHHFVLFNDGNDSNGLAAIVWFRDPDPARGYTGQWFQPVGDCTDFDPDVTVVGRLPRYDPGRLSGTYTVRDPKTDDVCHEVPAGVSITLKGYGVETWIYRSQDVVQAWIGASGWFNDGAWCTGTAATDASGTEIFQFRRMIAELAKYPRIARGQLDFVHTGAEAGAISHFGMNGIVQVEHDSTTLTSLPSSTVGQFQLTETWGNAPLAVMEWYWDYLEEYEGITCPTTRPNFSANAAMHAATPSDKFRMSLKILKR